MTPNRKLTELDQQKRGLQDDHDPNDLGQKMANKAEKSQLEGPAAYAPLPDGQSSSDEAREKRDKGQGIVRDERGQEQPADKKRAQQTTTTGPPEVSQSGQNSGYSSSTARE